MSDGMTETYGRPKHMWSKPTYDDLERQVADLTQAVVVKEIAYQNTKASVAELTAKVQQLELGEILSANRVREAEAKVADLTAKLKAKDAALEFAKAAIGDAIYLEEGLDGETGQRVQRLIVEALARGTCDAPGEIADFLTTRERVTQDQITNLTAQLDAAEERLSAMEQDRDKWRAMCNTFQVQRDKLTRRPEEAQRNSVPIKYFKAVQVNDPHSPVAEYMAETHDGEFVSRSVADALQAKLAAANTQIEVEQASVADTRRINKTLAESERALRADLAMAHEALELCVQAWEHDGEPSAVGFEAAVDKAKHALARRTGKATT